jgi:CMP-N-acetylneuraminic acid synthetase
MQEAPNCIALIPARSGSKRIPRKNIRLLNGIPLIGYSIMCAFETKLFSEIIVSTEDAEIADIARQFGASVPDLRPIEYAQDLSPDIEWVEHAITTLASNELADRDFVTILRPTSPFRSAQTVRNAISLFRENVWAESLRAMEVTFKHPGKMWTVNSVGEATPFLDQLNRLVPTHDSPTQSLPKVWIQNASLEIVRAGTILSKNSISGSRILSFQMPGQEGFDINTELDWKIAQLMITGAI